MQFDSSIETQQAIRRNLGLDPRMIRFSVVKIGDKLGGKQGSIEEITGRIPWRAEKYDESFGILSYRQMLRGGREVS